MASLGSGTNTLGHSSSDLCLIPVVCVTQRGREGSPAPVRVLNGQQTRLNLPVQKQNQCFRWGAVGRQGEGWGEGGGGRGGGGFTFYNSEYYSSLLMCCIWCVWARACVYVCECAIMCNSFSPKEEKSHQPIHIPYPWRKQLTEQILIEWSFFFSFVSKWSGTNSTMFCFVFILAGAELLCTAAFVWALAKVSLEENKKNFSVGKILSVVFVPLTSAWNNSQLFGVVVVILFSEWPLMQQLSWLCF